MRKARRPGPKPRLRSPMEYGRPFLTVDEFGECLGLSRAEAYKFLRHNKLPIAKNGKKIHDSYSCGYGAPVGQLLFKAITNRGEAAGDIDH